MSEEFTEKYSNSFRILHRIFYGITIGTILLLFGARLTSGTLNFVLILITLLVSFLLDEYFFYSKKVLNSRRYEFKCAAVLLMLSLIQFFGEPTVATFFFCAVVQFFVAFGFVLYSDIFFESYLINKRIYAALFTAVGFFAYFVRMTEDKIVLPFFMVSLFFILLWIVTVYSTKVAAFLDIKLQELRFSNEKLDDDKNKLLEYQNKVNSVNGELNRQKIDLARLNTELENHSLEMRALVDVMKEFSSSFDVRKSMFILTEKIYEVKNVDICAFYIDKGVYGNKEPSIELRSDGEDDEELFRSLIIKIYNIIQRKGDLQPLILADGKALRHVALRDTDINDAVAFPAYENGNIYGVMICASRKTDFFQNNYAFYESALIDFSSVLVSTKLYIQMEDMANKDSLTGMFNRLYFNRTFAFICKDAVESGNPLSVAMIDIDKFKRINDTYGHLAGDEVLKMVSGIMNEKAREHNGFAIRYGGEEFLFILPDKTVEEAVLIIDEIHRIVVSKAVKYDDRIIKVNISIGLSNYPETCKDINEVVNRADETMYFSKNHGRGMLVIEGREEESAEIYKIE